MKSKRFFAGIPDDITNRLDGLFKNVHECTLNELKEPTIDDLIETAIDAAEAYAGDLLEMADLENAEEMEHERYHAWLVLCNLKVIALLAKLKKGKPVTV